MPSRLSRPVLALGLVAALGGCATTDRYGYDDGYGSGYGGDGGRAAIGAVAGAALGAAVGSSLDRRRSSAGLIGGAIVGGLAGAAIARGLDDNDRRRFEDARNRGLDRGYDGSTIAWDSPDSGNYGRVRPGQRFDDDRGRECRAYESEVLIRGRREVLEGTACRDRDGRWVDARG